MLHGLTTITFFVDDVPAAAAWYADMLGVEPYFVRPTPQDPAYVEFRVGDHQDEIGLIDSRYRPEALGPGRPAGAVTYWHVGDVPAAVERLVELGATPVEAPVTREAGWVTASVADPFGNVLGLMHSPHYLEVLTGNVPPAPTQRA